MIWVCALVDVMPVAIVVVVAVVVVVMSRCVGVVESWSFLSRWLVAHAVLLCTGNVVVARL